MIEIRQTKRSATIVRPNFVLAHGDGLLMPQHGITAEWHPNRNWEVAPVGTVALILVAETMEKVAGVPLNVTLVVSPEHFPES
jgi:hypothetical protein